MNASKIIKGLVTFVFLGVLSFATTRSRADVLTQDAALKMMTKSGCAVCHAIDKMKIGPAYKDVAARYAAPTPEVKAYLKDQAPADYLFTKVRTGSKPGVNKNWIKSPEGKPYGLMTPNLPARINDADLKALIAFILSLK